MDNGILILVVSALGGSLLGAAVGWMVKSVQAQRKLNDLADAFQGRLDEVIAQRNDVAEQFTRSRARLKQVEAKSGERREKLVTLINKSRVLAKNVKLLQTERENTKTKLSTLQNALIALKQRTGDLQSAFKKAREFYKGELVKSLDARKQLEQEIKEARAQQQAFAKAVESSSLEHGSEENMVIAAQLRLGQLQVLERTVNKLEAENEQLRNEARQIRMEIAARDKDIAELEQLRINNKQLVKCVEALENSRKAHEEDANRYREKADQTEKLSDTLRMKLDDLQKNFADIEKQQSEAIEDVRKGAVVTLVRDRAG